MNIFKLRFAIYILLAVLALQKVSHEANTPNSHISTENVGSVAANNTVPFVSTKPIAPTQPLKAKSFTGETDSYSKQRQGSTEAVSEQKTILSAHLPTPTLPGIEVRDFIQTRLSSTDSQLSPPATRETAVRKTSAAFPAAKTLPVISLPSVAQQAPQVPVASLLPVPTDHAEDLHRILAQNQPAILANSGGTVRDKETVTSVPSRGVVAQDASTQFHLQEVQPFAEKKESYSAQEQRSNEKLTELSTTSSHLPEPTTKQGVWSNSVSEDRRGEGDGGEYTSPPSLASIAQKRPTTDDRTPIETVVGMTSPASVSVETLPATPLPSIAQQQAPPATPTNLVAAVPSHDARGLEGVLAQNQSMMLPMSSDTPPDKNTINPQSHREIVAQGASVPSRSDVEKLQDELRGIQEIRNQAGFQASPALSVVIPTGFGADRNTGFVSATYQQRTRDVSGLDDGGLGIGIGLGDARRSVGVELSYATASFGNSRDFGAGGFNVKVHRQLREDLAVAVGWNGFLNLGGRNDFEQSLYGVATKIFRTRGDINLPFSRVAVTAGIGNGQFETEDAVASGDNNVNVFGNIAVRIAQPLSLIAEWSGEDLGVGLSIAPFKNIPLVITPAVRDLAGAGDEPRFVLGTGFAFRF